MMQEYIVLDFETTGLLPGKDTIMEVAVLKVRDGQVIDTLDTLVNPEREISPVIQSVTGISNEMVRNARTIGEVLPELGEFCGDLFVVGHNVEFDRSFLRVLEADLPGPTIDTFFLSQVLLPHMGSHALNSLVKSLGFVHKNAHRALGDVEANLELFKSLEKRAGELSDQVRDKMAIVAEKSEGMKQYGKWLEQVISGKLSVVSGRDNQENFIIPKWKDSLGEDLKKVWNAGAKVVAELCGATDTDWVQFLMRQKEKTVFVAREFAYLKKLFAGQEDVSFWEEGKFLLDTDKFEEFLKKEHFTSDEFRVAWKILAAEEGAEHRSDFRLGGNEEFRIFETMAQINFENEESDARLLVVSPRAFYTDQGVFLGRDRLVMPDGSFLIGAYDQTNKISLYGGLLAGTPVESAGQKFFKEAGRFFVATDEGRFPTAAILNMNFWSDAQNQPLHKLILELSEEVKAYDAELTDRIMVFAGDDDKWMRVCWVWPDGRLSFTATPIDVRTPLQTIINNFARAIMGIPSRIGYPILRYLGGVDSSWEFVDASSRPFLGIPFYLHHSDTEKKDDEFLQRGLRAACQNWLSRGQDNLLILCNSVHMVEKNFLALAPLLENTDVEALGEGMSGGRRKILDELSRESRKALFCRYEFLPEAELHSLNFDRVIVAKVAFDPPSDPLLMERSKLYDNSFEQSALPRAALRLIKSLPPGTKEIVCLDHNMSKPWARGILDALGVNVVKKSTEELGNL